MKIETRRIPKTQTHLPILTSLWWRFNYLTKYFQVMGTILGTGDVAVNKTKFLPLWSCNSSVNWNISQAECAQCDFPPSLLEPCFEKAKKEQ